MILIRRISNKMPSWHKTCSYYLSTQSSQKINENEMVVDFTSKLPEDRKKKPNREPFMKNLFVGKFDNDILTYPESQSTDRHEEFLEWLKSFESFINSKIGAEYSDELRNEVFQQLKRFNIFRANMDNHFDGLNLSSTEVSKLIEVATGLPWLGSFISKNIIAPVEFISKNGSLEQKATYLPAIGTGEIVPTFCVFEKAIGTNTTNIETHATLSQDEQHWIITGTKTYVSDGPNADLFIVFAHCSSSFNDLLKHDMLSVFLIDRNTPGISLDVPIELVGQMQPPMCNVTFDNVQIPAKNIIANVGAGKNLLIDLLTPGNNNSAAMAVKILRDFIDLLVKYILKRKHLDQSMHQFEQVKTLIGRMTASLYNMESILYLTTGLADQFENQDVVIEKAIVESYCSKECVRNILKGLEFIGVQSYLKCNPQIHMFENALSLITLDGHNIESNTFIGSFGLQHAGKTDHVSIKKSRNPFMFPDHVIKQWFTGKKTSGLMLNEYLHPIFVDNAEVLDQCVCSLKNSSDLLLTRYGNKILEKEQCLIRLSEIASQVYLVVAVLGRASRAYCTGMKHFDQEKTIAICTTFSAQAHIMALEKEIEEDQIINGDWLYQSVSEVAYTRKQYFPEHPLTRNV